MSGYSDKDYLKAAIKLKAVNYMEKPLNPTEIREAVLEAIELYTKKIRSHRGETLQSMENASRLAQLLTTPGIDSLQAAEQLAEAKALAAKIDELSVTVSIKAERRKDLWLRFHKGDRQGGGRPVTSGY